MDNKTRRTQRAMHSMKQRRRQRRQCWQMFALINRISASQPLLTVNYFGVLLIKAPKRLTTECSVCVRRVQCKFIRFGGVFYRRRSAACCESRPVHYDAILLSRGQLTYPEHRRRHGALH